MLVTTHYLDEAEHCHRIAIIHAGKLAALGTASALKDRFADRPIIEVHASDPGGGLEGARGSCRRSRRPACSERPCTRCCAPGVTNVDVDHRSAGRAAARPSPRPARVTPSLEDVFLDVVEELAEARR